MKLLIASICLMACTFASATDLSGGLIIGSHNGISGKMDLANNRAIDAGLTFAIDSMYGFSLHGDYLFEKVKTLGSSHLYLGGGLRATQIKNGSDNGRTRLGLRAPIGLSYATSSKVELFAETAPVVYIINNGGISLDLGLGVRFQF
ncbi:hypothetical protein K2P97_12690 [bacterium]|nr:hypothetical protein [bacterium]